MKITVLSNNYSCCSLKAEHGLSLYIEFGRKKILIDGGQSNLFIENAKALKIDLSKLDYVFLTHGHYDHGDGLVNLKFNGQKIFIHKNALKKRYSFKDNAYKFNGLKWRNEKLNGNYELVFNENFTCIDESIYLSGSIPRPHGTPTNNFFGSDQNVQDIVEDEQLIIFEQPDGLVVVSGCTHYGIENMTDFLKSKFPNKNVKALFAGLHISKLEDKDLNNVISEIAKCDLYKKIYALHCTGEKAGRLIENNLNGKFVSVGDVFDI